MPEDPLNISARIVADSINPAGVRLTSWILRYPRFIHSEFMTHRCFSRNAASSRAIPFQKMMDAITRNTALPEYWGTTQAGMQSGSEPGEMGKLDAENVWRDAYCNAAESANELDKQGIHKSIANRLLEPFAHMTVLATATNHENFFALRAHPAAQPEFQVLAYRMLAGYLKSEPEQLSWGEWHSPKFDGMPEVGDFMDDARYLKIATARCARLSYRTQDGEHSPEKDIALHDRLLADGHLSPFEHCAQAINVFEGMVPYTQSNFDFGGGLAGWQQYRKTIKGELKRANLAEVMATKPDWITL